MPYTELARPTRECLDRHAPQAELYDVSSDPCGYWRVLCEVWADAESFVLIEHDATFDAHVIPALVECPRAYCKADGYFRFAKFDAALIRARPDAFAGMPLEQRHWTVLENFARDRLGPSHSHIADLGVGNGSGTRAIDSNEARRALWAGWLRTLPGDGPRQRVQVLEDAARAELRALAATNPVAARTLWEELPDDGSACPLPACRRSGLVAVPTTCDRCRERHA